MTKHTPSFRAQLLTRRTYNRPLEDGSFETWEQTVDRVIRHQKWLWERAKGTEIDERETRELTRLRELMMDRKVSVSGRTLWLGGTEVAMRREASQFNCSFSFAEDVFDIVDMFWLLLQGCGVGFKPVPGILNGFAKPVELQVIRSTKVPGDPKGVEVNRTKLYTKAGRRYWRLTIGDSAEAWAKAVGKLLALKHVVDVVVLDFSEVRAAGERLKGYGWISSGDESISKAFVAIAGILNRRAGKLLTAIDILDVMNWLGTTLSSRRSAEICVLDYEDPEAWQFIGAKKDHWLTGNPQRSQSNNSLLFWTKPTKMELHGVFARMIDAGGSEPGFINAQAARKRAPWFKGCNPCAEILLGNKSFCNLVEVDWTKFISDIEGLREAIYLAARANYRQTCVNLKDGILSDSWHELNEFLRLCGVGATGIVGFLDSLHYNDHPRVLTALRMAARQGAFSMADELGLPRPKAVTTVKPSGTLGKIMDTTEGVHKPLGKYIFNNVNFSVNDPLVDRLKAAGYYTFPHPTDPTGVIVRLPVKYENVQFDVVNGVEVNLESAVEQLERYKLMMDYYVDHNCSVTISYDPSEVPAIVDWLYENWDSYVGVSFVYRNDPTKTAEDLGYAYLPQEVVTRETWEAYVSKLLPVDLDAPMSDELLDEGCATGACPIR
ncbi:MULTISPECIES: ribonucleoside-triphosphate reductase, adenosylcobalamin-dependent [unclassified Aminobacter]|uniref:ribonucleoside-triphosphate reductase, adenosylcobalamin-dependent n=1 Tax=unclassified Aminobacter TaxID=2644704 RepID=UPI0004671ECF|nr:MULTISPECIES: ribonucleoside-triphosphate reductase, adenosylcobalamin-dependent [unclassified Aminobacter]TWH35583.1 ribonucleoside-triphosphate reductase [Aminobacter sp. J15]